MERIEGEFNLAVKRPELIDEWESARLDPRVRAIARHLAVDLHELGAEAVITEIFRDDRRSVHRYGRGIDIRLSVPMSEGEKLREKYNRWFPYGKGRIETIPPLDHGNSPHFHAQVKAL